MFSGAMREGPDEGESGFWSTLLWDGLQQRLLQVTIVIIININIINMIIVCSNINCVHVPSGLGQTQATFDIAMGQVSPSWSQIQIYKLKFTISKYVPLTLPWASPPCLHAIFVATLEDLEIRPNSEWMRPCARAWVTFPPRKPEWQCHQAGSAWHLEIQKKYK